MTWIRRLPGRGHKGPADHPALVGARVTQAPAGQGPTLSYPGSLRPMHGDPGTVTVGSTSRSGECSCT